MKSTLKLFKAIPIKERKNEKISNEYYKKILSKTIRKGFVFSNEVLSNYSEKELYKIIKVIDASITPEELNASLHKSFSKVKNASDVQLFTEQMIHYITTYGFEEEGINGETYIPMEALEIPELSEDIKLVIIKGYTYEELKNKLLNLLKSGIALEENTINEIVNVALLVNISEEDIDQINNKEVKSILYDYLDIIPSNPIEFLRFLIYKSTNSTLIIKNSELIKKIKENSNLNILKLIEKYEYRYGLEKLATIFYRYKPLWLAFKNNVGINNKINKIRKLARKCHEPMKEDFLNEITKKLKHNEHISYKQLENELKEKPIFRKIRLAYALNYRRLEGIDSILYKIRNGKSFATKFNFENKVKAETVYNIIINSIIEDVKKNVEGMNIYIPENIKYALPSTEKQFTGDFPNGTCIIIPNDIIFGIHWYNKEDKRVDLDLSLQSRNTGKIGWDSSYRTDDRKILFSGDVTDAPVKNNGASELFYVEKQQNNEYILFVNYFNYSSNGAPFKIIVSKADKEPDDFEKNYVVNPNDLITTANSEMKRKQKILGLLVSTEEYNKFYFSGEDMGSSMTSSTDEKSENARNYLFYHYENSISLNDVLIKAGANVVDHPEKADIDLSPENIEKDKIINLIDNKTIKQEK